MGKVSCIGSGSCDVARIIGDVDEVDFVGVKSGRKVHVENAKLVKCHDGHNTNKACESLATFQNVQCLYCGQHGCADHINTCRYKLASSSDEDDNEDETYIEFDKCKPETLLGGP